MSGDNTRDKRAVIIPTGADEGKCPWCADVEVWMDCPQVDDTGGAVGGIGEARAEWFYWDFMCGLGRQLALGYLAVDGVACYPSEVDLRDEVLYARELEKARVEHAGHVTATGEVGLMIHPRRMTWVGVPINWVPPEEADEE